MDIATQDQAECNVSAKSKLQRIAFIGNSLPRRCGIATFTTDLQQSVAASREHLQTSIIAMCDYDQTYAYPETVGFEIRDDQPDDYVRAANALNAGKFDVISLQHEFGIFGGRAGEHILLLMSRVTMPIVTTLHTVLVQPSVGQRRVLEAIIRLSAKIVVMAEKARALLISVYDVHADKIEVIAHGIPEVAFREPDHAKAQLGFAGRSVILTFGLLSPNKGIEVMIDAMPDILKQCPDAVYVVLVATHPNLVRSEGEAYRNTLAERARNMGVEAHVVFKDQFVDRPSLLCFIAMCDVYVSPYLNEAQMTSGTLAYSFGMGKAVVSTPYWHAQELLGGGMGVLVPFGDTGAIGQEVAGLLTNDSRRLALRRRAFAASRSMIWARTAERYLAVFESVQRDNRLKLIAGRETKVNSRNRPMMPEIQFAHLQSLCDDTGIYQHSVYYVPDRLHGYCVDDNARALLLACVLNVSGEKSLPEVTVSRFAAFIQNAWNPDKRRFRNFMSFDRRWLEDQGSEDSHGRTLWALGEATRSDPQSSRRDWAADLFAKALPISQELTSPRAWAFALLGLDGYCVSRPHDTGAALIRQRLAERLMALLAQVETKDWIWFEEGLAYDNARLSQAMMVTGVATQTPSYTDAGVHTLQWLVSLQTSPNGCHRPVGSQSFGDRRMAPKPFDQQPLEASATLSACIAAWHATGEPYWVAEAERAMAWFFGQNDLSELLVDADTGSCRDGLHPDRANENRGAESALCYFLGLVAIRQLARHRGNRSGVIELRSGRA